MAEKGTELAKAYVQIIPSAKGIKGKLTETLGGEASAAGDAAGNTIASSIKRVIAAAGIGQALKTALNEGAALQQSIGGIETLFKDSADKVIANAQKAYMTAGLSANEYMESVTSFSASLLQGLAGDTNKAADVADMALSDMSDNANKMGTSMELIQNAYQGFAKQNYTMLDNLKLGYGGTKTEMERLLADASKLSGVKYDISNLSDVYEAIHVIQDEMDITGTTAKEAASTFSGSLASMKSAAKNVMADLSLGKDISGSLRALTDTAFTFVNKNLFPMIGNIVEGIPYAIEVALTSAVQEINVIANNADELIQSGVSFVSQLVTGMISNIPHLLDGAIRLISAFGNAILSTDWMTLATDMINGLRDKMELAAGEIFGTDGNIIDAVMSAITNNLPLVLGKGVEIVTNIANGILQNIPSIITGAGELLKKMIGLIADNFPVLLESGFELITNLAAGIVENIPSILTSMAEVIVELLASIGEKLPDVLQKGIELLGELGVGIIKGIPDLLGKIPEVFEKIKEKFEEFDWKEIGTNIVDGIVKGLKNALSNIIEAAKEVASGALESAKSALGIHSPSRAFEFEVGKMIDLGLAAGIKNNMNAVSAAMKDLSAETVGMINTDINVPNNAYSASTTEYNNQLLVTMQQMRELLEYLPMLAHLKVVMDTGETVGALAPGMDEALGIRAARAERMA